MPSVPKETSNSAPHNDLGNNTKEVADQFAQVLKHEAQAILEVAGRADENVVEAIRLIFACKGRLIVTGMGKMGCIARKAAATFSSTGTPAVFLHPGEAVHGDLGIVTTADILIAISNSGETNEILDLIPFMKRNEIPLITITGNPTSSLARHADVVIDGRVEHEADPDSIAPTSSTTVALAICDALAVSLMQQRGFSKEQFAIFHPGGHLGRKLLLTVKDLMHVGEALPTVDSSATLSKAIKTISSGNRGAVFVLDKEGRVEGVLTDGDVRRIFEATAQQGSENPLVKNVAMFMSTKPASIQVDALAAEALSLMEDREITVLPVLNDNQQLVGIVHMHDLIRSGLA